MGKATIISNDVKLTAFPPNISKQGAHIFWEIQKQRGTNEKDFFLEIYGKKGKYEQKKKEELAEQDEIKKRLLQKKPTWEYKRSLRNIRSQCRKLVNMRRTNDKQWVALFSKKSADLNDKRAHVLYPSSIFFFIKFCEYYDSLIKKKDAGLSIELHQRAHFLDRYYGPEFLIMLMKGVLRLLEEDPYHLQLIREKYGIENPYEVYVKLIEELFYEGLRIMLHKNDRREYFKENNTQWSRFSYEVAYCHWPVYFAMVGKSPMEKLIVGNATELMSKYDRRLFNWKRKRTGVFPRGKVSRFPPPSASSPVSSRAKPASSSGDPAPPSCPDQPPRRTRGRSPSRASRCARSA